MLFKKTRNDNIMNFYIIKVIKNYNYSYYQLSSFYHNDNYMNISLITYII